MLARVGGVCDANDAAVQFDRVAGIWYHHKGVVTACTPVAGYFRREASQVRERGYWDINIVFKLSLSLVVPKYNLREYTLSIRQIIRISVQIKTQ